MEKRVFHALNFVGFPRFDAVEFGAQVILMAPKLGNPLQDRRSREEFVELLWRIKCETHSSMMGNKVVA